jgi:hypothetical protein
MATLFGMFHVTSARVAMRHRNLPKSMRPV